jgi:hypothetical protein
VYDKENSKRRNFEMLKGRVSKEELETILFEAINGLELPKTKSLAKSIFIELEQRTEEKGETLDDEQFGNMIRELNALLFETRVMSAFLQKALNELDPETRKQLQDRRTSRRKPVEDFYARLVGN